MCKSAEPMRPAHLQAAAFSQLDKGRWTVWEALDRLGTLREYEAALLAEPGSDIPLLEHASQTAEACRAAFPESDWLHLCGLIHGLGKVLAHARCGALAACSCMRAHQHCVTLGRGVCPCKHGLAGCRAMCSRPCTCLNAAAGRLGDEAVALLVTSEAVCCGTVISTAVAPLPAVTACSLSGLCAARASLWAASSPHMSPSAVSSGGPTLGHLLHA